MNSSTGFHPLSLSHQHCLIKKLHILKIQGRDKRGNLVLLVVGRFFPAKLVSFEALRTYLEDKIFPALRDQPFCVVYLHTKVRRSENFPGFSMLRSIYEAIPANVKDNIEAVYFVHPGIQSRLFLATFGRFLFSAGLYGKVKYVMRLEFLWEWMKRKELDIPGFVNDHDDNLDCDLRSIVDYGPESDYPRFYNESLTASTYSMRCIG